MVRSRTSFGARIGLADVVVCPQRPVAQGLEGAQAVLGDKTAEQGRRAGVIVLAVGGALGYRALCQRRAARALMISSPAGIVEDGYVRIGGIDQWIQIRGQDRANPVLLFLHGAGMTMTPFFLFHGDADQHTLTSLATEYFAGIDAPVKDMALIPGGGHCAVLTQPDAILAHLRAMVAPHAAAASRGGGAAPGAEIMLLFRWRELFLVA